MNRCDYCGRTEHRLNFEFSNESEELLCRCCNHCPDCKLIVDKHVAMDRFTTTKAIEKGDKTATWGYPYHLD